jgi:hypothetical protein
MSLVLIKHHAISVCGSGGLAPFLTSTLNGRCQIDAPSHLSLGKSSGTYWTGGWTGPTANLVVVAKINVLPVPEVDSCLFSL